MALQKTSCPYCGKDLGNAFAFIEGGALFMVDEGNSEIRDEMEGFLSIGYHGSGQEASAISSVFERAKHGQFEMAFCSTSCLRAFLNSRVDDLEQKLRRSG